MDEQLYDSVPYKLRRSASSTSLSAPPPDNPVSAGNQSDFHSDTDTSSSVNGDLEDAPDTPLIDTSIPGPPGSTDDPPVGRRAPESVPLPDYGDQTDEDEYGGDNDAFYKDYKDPDSRTKDDEMDLKNQRPGRMSKGWEKPGTVHSNSGEALLAQIYDLTHAIDALDNDLDQIAALRKVISHLNPRVDVGGVSIKSDLDSLAALTTDTGHAIVALEQWLTELHDEAKKMRADVKSGRADFSNKEMAELKFQIASAKLDFADGMERVREGAWKEERKRLRVRNWMAEHIRAREDDISDTEVKSLLKASELGAADGVIENDVTSYAGLWALNNPFTELAELTNGMRWLHNDLDREIVNAAIPGNGKSKSSSSPKSKSKSKSSSSKSSKKSSSSSFKPPGKSMPFFGSRAAFVSYNSKEDSRIRAINAEVDGANSDLAYGFARQKMLEKSAQRKKLIIALLSVVVFGLILLIWFATMDFPYESSAVHGNSGSSATILNDNGPGQSDGWATEMPSNSNGGWGTVANSNGGWDTVSDPNGGWETVTNSRHHGHGNGRPNSMDSASPGSPGFNDWASTFYMDVHGNIGSLPAASSASIQSSSTSSVSSSSLASTSTSSTSSSPVWWTSNSTPTSSAAWGTVTQSSSSTSSTSVSGSGPVPGGSSWRRREVGRWN